MSQYPKSLDYHALAEDILANNPILVDKISSALGIKKELVITPFNETLKFLFLINYYKTTLSPSLKVDLAWHEFILNTKLYMNFCKTHFNRYIHHTPGGDEKENQRQFQRTLSLYNINYGHPLEEYWGTQLLNSSSCGSCESN